MRKSLFLTAVIVLTGCAGGTFDERAKKQELKNNFEEYGACLSLYHFTRLSVMKNMGGDYKQITKGRTPSDNSWATGFYKDGNIIIEYRGDSLKVAAEPNAKAISSAEWIAAMIDEKGVIYVGTVSTSEISCTSRKPSGFLKPETIKTMSKKQMSF